MTVKECGHYEEDEESSQLRYKRILLALLSILLLIAFIIFLVWIILQPKKPRFVLQDATLYAFNLSVPNLLTSNLQVTLSSRNPNDKIGIYYDSLDIYASYRNQQVTLATLLPTTYQGHKDVTVWSPYLYGNGVPVAPYLAPALAQDLNAGILLLDIRVDGRVKWKVGTWFSGGYRLHVNCPAYIMFSDRSAGAGVQVGPAVKFQLVQRCTVDV